MSAALGRARLRVWVRAACIVFLCGILSGCSATRLVYNQFDWVIVWYLNGHFSLDDAQEDHLREAVNRNLEWHRRTQLPKYAQFTRALGRDANGVITEATLELRYQRGVEFGDELIRQLLPDVSAFFLTLSDEQINEFVESLEEDNQELWDEYAGETAEERFERREKAAYKGFKRVIGRLTDAQKELIRSYMANMHDVSEYWIESRRRWQHDFRDLLQERPAEPGFTDRLTSLLLDPNKTDDAGYRQQVEENRRNFIAMTAALSGSLTDKQRQRVSERLNDFARDFEILAIEDT